MSRGIAVTSSLNEISTDRMLVMRGGGGVAHPQASGQIFEDDVNGFSST